jgi:hypothetical protein
MIESTREISSLEGTSPRWVSQPAHQLIEYLLLWLLIKKEEEEKKTITSQNLLRNEDAYMAFYVREFVILTFNFESIYECFYCDL